MSHVEPFHFYTERRLVQLTGLTARSLPELLALLREVPGSCIFYHTHHLFLSHHFEKPVMYNDFSNWASSALREEELAEKLSAINLLEFTSVRQIREAMIALLEEQLGKANMGWRECPRGYEFRFCKSKSFIMPTGIVAVDIPEFFASLARISNISLYFHFLESRLRLECRTNDFSQWLGACGEDALAAAINRLDPYAVTLPELRNQILELGRRDGFN